MISTNKYSYEFFLNGREDASADGKMHNYIANISIMYRLGFFYETSPNSPKKLELIHELCREFAMMESDFPNFIEVSLLGHYSHRLLRQTMSKIGYRIPLGRIDSSEFCAWRIN